MNITRVGPGRYRVELDKDGLVAEVFVPSKSHPEREPYRMVRSVSGRWSHADARCEGWTNNQHCYHVESLEAVMADEEPGTELVISSNPLALIGAMEIADVIKGFTAVGEWRYSFRRKGQEIEGLSVDGVQDGVRQMSRLGEAIRTLWVHLEKETDREAFYTAMAARYAISPDGQEICMDTTIRGKRVSKFETKADGSGEYFNEAWYEHGVTKAARNAEEALMPEALKQWMIAAARDAAAAKQPRNGAPRSAAPPATDQLAAQQDLTRATKAFNAALKRLKEETHPDYVRTIGVEVAKLLPNKTMADGSLNYAAMTAEDCRKATALILDALDGSPAEPKQAELVP